MKTIAMIKPMMEEPTVLTPSPSKVETEEAEEAVEEE
jgi:hypothetical protein